MTYYLLSIFWFIRQIKAFLFWLYLWQLKEYHIGRFIDHFRTEKGKRVLFNKLSFLKLFLFFTLLIIRPAPVMIYILLAVYLLESGKAFSDFFQKKLQKPVFTIKTYLLITIILAFQTLFIFLIFGGDLFLQSILLFDILTPALVSGIVLFFQPLIVLWRRQLIRRAKLKRKKLKNLLVIGITGSYGKTSTKEFLATILEERFKVLKTKEHQNSETGISQCILNDLREEHEVFIVEMGAYNKGGIRLLCDITQPKIGVLTGINEQHLALFGSLEKIIQTKYELIQSLTNGGLAIFNGDNTHCFKLWGKTTLPKKIYSLQSLIYEIPSDIWAYNIKSEKESLSFRVVTKEEQTDFRMNLMGEQNISNILAATTVAKELGLTLEEISKACQKIKPEQGAMKLLKRKDGLNVIDSIYSANPDGVISHLDYLKVWEGQKIIIMPCLIELGGASGEAHKQIGQKIGEVCDFAIITTREKFREIKRAAIEKGMEEESILFMENPKLIYEKLRTLGKPGDIILLEGRVPNQLINLLRE